MSVLQKNFPKENPVKLVTYHVQVGGKKIHYQAAGSGEPVVLVHGLCGSTLWWTRNVAALARFYRVYLVDLPGFGVAHFPRARFQLAESAAWLQAWLKAIGVQKAHFLGHSMGGYICLRLAALQGDMIDRLVLVSPAVKLSIKRVPGYWRPLLASLPQLNRRFMPILCYDALRAGPITLWQAARDLLAQVHTSPMEFWDLPFPVLLVWGEKDFLVPVEFAPLVQQALPQSRLLCFKQAGHISMFDCAADFNEAVLAFLRGADE